MPAGPDRGRGHPQGMVRGDTGAMEPEGDRRPVEAALSGCREVLNPVEGRLWAALLVRAVADDRSRFWRVAEDQGPGAAAHNSVAGYWLAAAVATMALGLAARAVAGAALQLAAVGMLGVSVAHLVARQRCARRHHRRLLDDR